MNIFLFFLLAYFFCAGWALIDSEWQEFKEDADEDDIDPYDGQNGI